MFKFVFVFHKLLHADVTSYIYSKVKVHTALLLDKTKVKKKLCGEEASVKLNCLEVRSRKDAIIYRRVSRIFSSNISLSVFLFYR
jgi:hypothetical protein